VQGIQEEIMHIKVRYEFKMGELHDFTSKMHKINSKASEILDKATYIQI